MFIGQLGGVEGPIFFGPDLQLGLSAEIWHHGLRPDLPARASSQLLAAKLEICEISGFRKFFDFF